MSNTQKQIQEELDNHILETIKAARETGQPLQPAMVKAINERYKNVQPAFDLPGGTRSQIMQNLRLAGHTGELPPLDEESDDAATA